MLDKIYEKNDCGVIINPDIETIHVPKSYKFELNFKIARFDDTLHIGFDYMCPDGGAGTGCFLEEDYTEKEYKNRILDMCIDYIVTKYGRKGGVCPSWYQNTGPKVVKILEEYKEELNENRRLD